MAAVFGKTQAVHEPAGLNRTARLAGRTVPRQVRVEDRPREEWTAIPVPALVDQDTFDRVQQRLAGNKRFAARNTKVPSLLQGLAACASCGYGYYRTSTTTSSGKKIYYYRCLGSDDYRYQGGRVCGSKPVRAGYVDAVVWDHVAGLLADPALIRAEIGKRLERARTSDPVTKKRGQLTQALAKTSASIAAMVTAFSEQLLTIDELRARMPDLRARETGLKDQIAALDVQAADRDAYLKLADDLQGFPGKLRANSATATTEDRQRVLRALVQDVLVGPEKLTIRHRIPVREPSSSGGSHHDTTDTEGDMRQSSLLRWGRDKSGLQGQPGQVGAAAAAGLVPDPVQVRADRADADVQVSGDLGVGAAPGDRGDQLPFPGAELAQSWRRLRLPRGGDLGEHQGVLGRGGPAHRRAAFLGRSRPGGPEDPRGLAHGFKSARIGGPAPEALVSGKRHHRGPHRDGLGVAPGHGAQVPAGVQDVEQLLPAGGTYCELERLAQVRCGVLDAACLQVQGHHPRQQATLVPQVACAAGSGQPRRADILGDSQVAGRDQHAGQQITAPPGYRGGDAGRDLRRPAGPATRHCRTSPTQNEARLRSPRACSSPSGIADVPGHGQPAAAILGRLGEPARLPQRRRPASQSVGQRPRRPAVRDGVAQCGKVVQRPGHISRKDRRPAEPELRGAPPVAAQLGKAGRRAQQPVLTWQPTAQDPPRRQRNGQPQREGRIVVHGPGQHLPHRGVLGIQPAGRGQLPLDGLQPRPGLLGHLQRVPGQRGGRPGCLAGPGQQPGPVGAQRLQHRVPGPAIRSGPRRAQQRAVHQVQHRRAGALPATASAASRVNGPGNTDTARNTRCSASASSW